MHGLKDERKEGGIEIELGHKNLGEIRLAVQVNSDGGVDGDGGGAVDGGDRVRLQELGRNQARRSSKL